MKDSGSRKGTEAKKRAEETKARFEPHKSRSARNGAADTMARRRLWQDRTTQSRRNPSTSADFQIIQEEGRLRDTPCSNPIGPRSKPF